MSKNFWAFVYSLSIVGNLYYLLDKDLSAAIYCLIWMFYSEFKLSKVDDND